MGKTTKHEFKTEAKQLLNLMINSVYSQKEIFLRELISNSSDALDKLRFESLTNEDVRDLAKDLYIRIEADNDKKILTISDNGIGMSKDDIVNYIGTIAKSGTGDFTDMLKKAKEQKDALPELIGQFGVGFYSCFMVTDKVELVSKKAGEDKAWKWVSEGDGSYTLEETEKESNGTVITLYLKAKEENDDEFQDYSTEWTIKEIVKKYSDFVAYPIKMQVERKSIERDEDGKAKEGAVEETIIEDEVLNSMKAIWLKSAKDVKDEDYKEFYKHISHDWNDPLEWITYKAAGASNEFSALLYLPSKPGMEMFMPNAERGINLYIKRVFIMNDCEELIPEYLRFVKGVVDSEDLSLNISREILQQNRQINTIRKAVTRKVLDALKKLLRTDRDKYNEFWNHFGSIIKEGLFKETEYKDKIFDAALFQTTASPSDLCTVDDYIERMKDGQDKIYFITGESRTAIENSPHLEAFKDKGYEVLLLTDPVDEVWVQYANEYKEKKFKSAAKGDLELGTEEERKKEAEDNKQKSEELKSLFEAIQKNLEKYVKEVRISTRLSSSAACLVSGEGDMSPHLETLLRASGKDVPEIKRTLELNPSHPLMAKLQAIFDKDKDSSVISAYSTLLYGQALLAEGGQLPDPAAFNKQVADLMVASA